MVRQELDQAYSERADLSALIANGIVEGYSAEDKFGHQPNFAIADSGEDFPVWDMKQLYTFMDSAVKLYISSANAGDTMAIQIFGYDSAGKFQNHIQTIAGQTKTEIGTDLLWTQCVYRIFNPSGTKTLGQVYVYEDDTPTNGVPQTATKIKGAMTVGSQQTESTVFCIPSDKQGELDSWWSSILKAGVKNADVTLVKQEAGGVVRDIRHIGLTTGGDSYVAIDYKYPKILPPLTRIYIRVDLVGANATGISGGYEMTLIDLVESN